MLAVRLQSTGAGGDTALQENRECRHSRSSPGTQEPRKPPCLPDKAAEHLRLKAAVGRVGVGVDLLLIEQRDFDRRSQVPGTLPYWAKKEGRVLHDAAA